MARLLVGWKRENLDFLGESGSSGMPGSVGKGVDSLDSRLGRGGVGGTASEPARDLVPGVPWTHTGMAAKGSESSSAGVESTVTIKSLDDSSTGLDK